MGKIYIILSLIVVLPAMNCKRAESKVQSSSAFCEKLNAAEKSLNSDQREDLERSGFTQPFSVDFALVSAKFSDDCDLRYFAGRFIEYKINENSLPAQEKEYVLKHQCEVARVALAATKAGVWRGAGIHQIFSVVSDELMPCWADIAIADMQSHGSLNFSLLHKQMILNPGNKLVPILEKELNNSNRNLVSAMGAHLLLRNAGIRKPFVPFEDSNPRFFHVPKEEYIKKYQSLKSKTGKIIPNDLYSLLNLDDPL